MIDAKTAAAQGVTKPLPVCEARRTGP
jgi:hypothetical protein